MCLVQVAPRLLETCMLAASGLSSGAWDAAQVESLAKPQLRYKVDVNAVENHLTGAAIITDDFCIVVVEGGGWLLLQGHPVKGSAGVELCTAVAHGGAGSVMTHELQVGVRSNQACCNCRRQGAEAVQQAHAQAHPVGRGRRGGGHPQRHRCSQGQFRCICFMVRAERTQQACEAHHAAVGGTP